MIPAKKYILATVLVMLLWCPAQAEYGKTKVAVLKFEVHGSGFEAEDMGRIVAEWLIKVLVKNGRFEIVNWRLLEEIIQEQKLTIDGVDTPQAANQFGKLLGVNFIISGSVFKFQNVTEVQARVINVETASIIASESARVISSLNLEHHVIQIAEIIINKGFPIEGYVVGRDKDTVVIDSGKLAGVKKGMHFTIYTEGQVIKHPKTGEVLGVEEISTGVVEVFKVTDMISIGKVIEEAKDHTIQSGQQVKNVAKIPKTNHTSMQSSINYLPEFPWPPPAASSFAIISILDQMGDRQPSLHHADIILRNAFVHAGHYEISYYSVPDGFAVVSRLEQIEVDGSPKPPPARWQKRVTQLELFSLKKYLQALFVAPPGYYRLIVFVVSPHQFSQSPSIISRDIAESWLRFGGNKLPEKLAQQPYTDQYVCTALIYEFEKSDKYEVALLIQPSRLDAKTHLMKSGIGRYFQ
jgi:TolB-like protein